MQLQEKPLSGRPITIDGVTFRPYRTGILRSEWRSDCGLLAVSSRPSRDTYRAVVDGKTITGKNPTEAKRFRSQMNAMRAAVKAMRA